MREMKWHIVDGNNNPLCWEHDDWKSERAIEFDTREEALEFMKIVFLNYPNLERDGASVIEGILYYDGGYVSGAEAKRLMEEELGEY